MKQLKQYILNETRKVINEELGISREVQEETTNIINSINDILSRKNFFNYRIEGVNVYGTREMYRIKCFNTGLSVCLEIYFAGSKDELSKITSQMSNPEKYHFEPHTNAICLRFPILRENNFDLNRDVIQIGVRNTRIRGVISHELKHAFQMFKMREKSKNINCFMSYKESYIYAVGKSYYRGKDPNLKKLGYMLYYTSPSEITANIEKLYTDIIQNADSETEALNELINSRYMSVFDTLGFFIEEIEKCIQTNDTQNQWMIACEKFKQDCKDGEIHSNINIKWVLNRFKKAYNKLNKGINGIEKLINRHFNKTQPTE
jgi:hypothetical protein